MPEEEEQKSFQEKTLERFNTLINEISRINVSLVNIKLKLDELKEYAKDNSDYLSKISEILYARNG